MPTYEYACASCGKRYEKREGFDAPARQKCQYCGKTAARVLQAPPVVFKGSGFYVTDNRGGSSPATNGNSSSDGGSSGSSETSEAAAAS